jgi:hypothetical protein
MTQGRFEQLLTLPGKRPAKGLAQVLRQHLPRLLLGVALIISAALWMRIALEFSQQVHLHFDEAYNLNQAVTMAEFGLYGVRVNGQVELFDPKVTSGPGLLVPLVLALRAWGTDLETVRYIMVGGFMLAAGILWLISRRYMRPALALLFVWITLATPRLLFFGVSIMGELVALAYLFGHIVVWDRAHVQRRPAAQALLYVCAGVLLGLAVLTKTISVLLFPALVLVSAREWLRDRSWKKAAMLALPALGAAGLPVGWNLYQYGYAKAVGYDAFVLWEFQTQAAAQTLRAAVILGRPLQHFDGHWREAWQQFGAIVTVAFLALPAGLLLRRILRLEFSRSVLSTPGLQVLLSAVILWLGWFYFVSGPQANSRHLVFSIVFFHFLMCRVLECLPLRRNGREAQPPPATPSRYRLGVAKATTLVLASTLAVAMATNAVVGFRFVQQYAVASRNRHFVDLKVANWVIQNLPADARLAGWGWWVPWSLAYLSDREAGRAQVYGILPAPISDYMIKIPEMVLASDPRFEAFLAENGSLLYAHGGYEVYGISPQAQSVNLVAVSPDHVQLSRGFSLRPPSDGNLAIHSENAGPGTVAYFDGIPLATTYGNPTLLSARVPARLWNEPGLHTVHLQSATSRSDEAVIKVELP